jgi:integrase/recombinase XerD
MEPITAGNIVLNSLSLSRSEAMLEAFADFLRVDVADGDATADTVLAYRREVGYFVAWCREKRIEPASATRRTIVAYREELKARGLSVTTRSHKLSIVRRFYEAALKHDLIKINPADKVAGGKDLTPPEEKLKALTAGAMGALIASIPQSTLAGKRDRALVALMVVHGLRRIEVHRLNHESIDIESEPPAIVVHGKGNRIRRIYLREDTFTTIRTYIEAKLEEGLPLSGALFVSNSNRTRGERISRRTVNMIVDNYLSGANLKRVGVSCHALRHTHGTLAVAGGAALEHLRDEMGHSKLETTGIYVKAVGRVKNNPANFIDVDF